MQTSNPNHLREASNEQRLAALENANRQLRRIVATLALCAASAVAMAATWQQPGASQAPQAIRATRVEIVDDRGIVIAALCGAPVENGLGEKRSVGALLLSDHFGGAKDTLRTMQIAAHGGFMGGVEVLLSSLTQDAPAQSAHGDNHISFAIDNSGPVVRLGRHPIGRTGLEGSRIYLSCTEYPDMQFFDDKGLRRAVLGVDHATGKAAYSLLNDSKDPDAYTWRAAK